MAANELLDFIAQSPSTYHVINNVKLCLEERGFQELCLKKTWKGLMPGGKYFTTRAGSSIIAFTLAADANQNLKKEGFNIVCTHSDAPCLKVKPNAEMNLRDGQTALNVEVYGGPILHTWFDRPLSFAGRVVIYDKEKKRTERRLVDIIDPIGVIPSVAIHFNRKVNDDFGVHAQTDTQILVSTTSGDVLDSASFSEAIANKLNVDVSCIIDYDLFAYIYERGHVIGLDQSLIVSPKLDDLAMVYSQTEAFCNSLDLLNYQRNNIMCIFDNEEVGSGSKQGADSSLLADVIERIILHLNLNPEERQLAIYNSFMISADMAHAAHPNHPEFTDPTNRPRLNGGPVIKYNAKQKYMTDSESATHFKMLCQLAGVPFQTFVNRSDIAGGSTLGNKLVSQINIQGVDVGNPMLGMHSAVETAGALDVEYMTEVLERFYVS